MASRFWVGGGASTNWNATGNTNWSATSGGANNASVPTTTDDVFFDGNSGAGTSVISASITIQSLDCTGYTGTLTHSATVTISGTLLKMAAGMTYSATGGSSIFSFTGAATPVLVTSAGLTMGGITVSNAAKTVQLQDDITMASATGGVGLTLTAGVFDANNKNVTTQIVSSSNSNTRTLTMGSGTWTVTQPSGTIFTFAIPTNATINAGTSTLVIPGTSTGNRAIGLGNLAVNNIVVGSDTSGHALTFSLTHCANLTINAPSPVLFSNFVSSGIFSIVGASRDRLQFLYGQTIGSTTGFSLAGTYSFDWLVLRGLNFSGAGTVIANNSIDLKDNTGSVTINPPSAALDPPIRFVSAQRGTPY